MIVASTIVPLATFSPLAAKCRCFMILSVTAPTACFTEGMIQAYARAKSLRRLIGCWVAPMRPQCWTSKR